MTDFEISGLHNEGEAEKRYFRLANLVIDSNGNVSADEKGNPVLKLDYPVSKDLSKSYGEEVRKKMLRLCNLKKGVSDVVLDYGTMMITQELFSLTRRYPFFVLLLLGRHGSFKTMLSKRTTFLLADSRIQEEKFYNLSKNASLEELLDDTEIYTVLIDDIIPVKGYNQKKRFADVFDWVSRSGDRERFKGGTIITAERIPDEVVSSAYDRIWEIKMPAFTDAEKINWYTALSDVTNRDLAIFYIDYCRKLMKNYDEVLTDIRDFWTSFELPECISRATRIADHFEFIVLSEFLFQKYYLEQMGMTIANIQRYDNNSLLVKGAELQQKRIQKMDKSNCDADIAYSSYQVILSTKRTINLIASRSDYEKNCVNTSNALLNGNYIYIKPAVLHEAINKYTGLNFTLKMISSSLEQEGILYSGGGNSKTVTEIKCGRHYKLNQQKLIAYREEYVRVHGQETEDTSEMVVKVIRS